MLFAFGNRYVSDIDHLNFIRGPRQPYTYSDRPDPFPPPQPIDHARRAAYQAYAQNRGYAPDFIGPRFQWGRSTTPVSAPAIHP